MRGYFYCGDESVCRWTGIILVVVFQCNGKVALRSCLVTIEVRGFRSSKFQQLCMASLTLDFSKLSGSALEPSAQHGSLRHI